MTKLLTVATVAAAFTNFVLAGNAKVTAGNVNESCSIVDFTAQETQFTLLNNAIDVATQSTLLSTVLTDYDPLVLQDVKLGQFSYSLLGQDLTFTPTLKKLNAVGLKNIVPEHINASSSNCVGLGASCNGNLSIDATVSLTLEEIDVSISADISLSLEKPTLASDVQADMYGCADGATDCDPFTVTSIEVAGVDGKYSTIMDSLLLRFKDAAVHKMALDFASIINFDFSLNGSGAIISAITDLMADFTAEEINKKGDMYDTFTSKVDDQLLKAAENFIDSKLKPGFGATCLKA